MDHGVTSLHFRQGALVRTCGYKGIVNVHYLQHPRQDGNIVTFQAVRISGAIPMLMVMANYGQHFTEGLQWLTDSLAIYRMALHHIPLGGGQLSSLL